MKGLTNVIVSIGTGFIVGLSMINLIKDFNKHIKDTEEIENPTPDENNKIENEVEEIKKQIKKELRIKIIKDTLLRIFLLVIFPIILQKATIKRLEYGVT